MESMTISSNKKKKVIRWVRLTTGILLVGTRYVYYFSSFSIKKRTWTFLFKIIRFWTGLPEQQPEATGRKRLVFGFQEGGGGGGDEGCVWVVNNHTCTKDDLTRIYRSVYRRKGTFIIQTYGTDVTCSLKQAQAHRYWGGGDEGAK